MRVIAAVIAVCALWISVPQLAAGAARTASQSVVPSSAPAKTPIATFGAGPANTKGPDGRSTFTYTTAPGGRLNDHIAILNLTHHVETLAIYTVDATPGVHGTFSYAAKSAPRTFAGAWVSVGTPHASGVLHAKPRSTTILPVHLVVPLNAPPGDHVGAVIVSLTGLVKGKSGQRVHLEQRVATRVVVRVGGKLVPKLAIDDLHAVYSGVINPLGSGSVTVTYVVRNTGNVILGGSQQVSTHGLFGTTTKAPRVPTVPALLPGGSFHVRVHVPDVFPELRMSANVRIAPEGLQGELDPGLQPVAASADFWAIPWVLIAIITFLLIVLTVVVRRRRRSHKANLPQVAAPSEGTQSHEQTRLPTSPCHCDCRGGVRCVGLSMRQLLPRQV